MKFNFIGGIEIIFIALLLQIAICITFYKLGQNSNSKIKKKDKEQ